MTDGPSEVFAFLSCTGEGAAEQHLVAFACKGRGICPSCMGRRMCQTAANLCGCSRITFAVAKSTDYPGRDYDLVAHFDCLHDMEDPTGAAKHVHDTLKPDGTWMIVEPFANDRPEENHNPVGRVYYSASTMLCVPHSLAFGGPALGAQAGERKLREVASAGGFRRLRRATETPFNLVLEARR